MSKMNRRKAAPADLKDPSNIVPEIRKQVLYELGDISQAIAYRNLFSLASGMYGIIFKVFFL